MNLFEKLKRTTSSTRYIPQIDGLRFLAISLVVVQMHITHYIDEKLFQNQLFPGYYWRNFIMEGNNGVYLFFVISGFILSYPFAKSYLIKDSRISLGNYYLRRLIRLEPPYFICLTLAFIAQVWLINKYSFTEAAPHYLSSAFYMHNFIYSNFSTVLPHAWTLEVEVQFYIIAPLLATIFFIRPHVLRWIIHGLIILLSIYYFYYNWKGVGNVFSCIFWFYGGIMLADFYVNKIILIKNQRAGLHDFACTYCTYQ
jgi:peptidoglycan/LPS O-acetylase OafA/YrhL